MKATKFLIYMKAKVYTYRIQKLGISFYFRGNERSLSEDEMGQQLEKVLEVLHQKYNVTLRP